MTGVMRILWAEDNEHDVLLFKKALRSWNIPIDLHVCADGHECLSKLKEGLTQDELPHLVLLDVNIPKRNGFEVLKEIRKNKELKHLPVIIFSGSLNKDEWTKAYGLCADCYIRKPQEFAEYNNVIDQIKKYWIETQRTPKFFRF